VTSSGAATTPRFGRQPSAAVVGFGVAAALCALWLLLPPTGSDLSAQVAHAEFAAAHLWYPVDLRWFGGTDWLSYSLLTPPLMAALGVRLVGAVSTVVAAALLGLLMGRCGVPRPRAGAAVGALCLSASLLVGRLTFTVGVAAALTSLIAVTLTHWSRWPLLVVGPVVTWAASPLAALFLGLVGVALLVRRRGGADVIVLTAAVTVALAASLWLGQGGTMPASAGRELEGVAVCAVVAVVTRYPVVRIGALLAAAGLVLSLLVDTEVGLNAMRLPELFAAPVAVATSRVRLRLLVPAVAVIVGLAPPLTADDVTAIGEPSNDASYYAELNSELARLPLSGRVEIPPTLQRWESVYVAERFPLARGWMTQLDLGYNPLFFASQISPAAYRTWLDDNAVQYVAVPHGELAEAGRTEAMLVGSGLPFLHQLWKGEHWTVYAVVHPTATVMGGRLVSQDAESVTFVAASPRTVHVRVRWSRWLTLDGPDGCLRRDGTWTEVTARRPGTYRISSALFPGGRRPLCPTA
jgi:hypothetical protein